MSRIGRKLVLLILLTTTVGCDRITKHIASVKLEGEAPRTYASSMLRLEYAENTGAFLSLGSELPETIRTGLLTFGVGLLLVVLALAAFKYHMTSRALFGVTLIWAGGASNLFDRIMHGSVVDFINIGIGSLRTGIFNVADVAIFSGIVLFVSVRNSR